MKMCPEGQFSHPNESDKENSDEAMSDPSDSDSDALSEQGVEESQAEAGEEEEDDGSSAFDDDDVDDSDSSQEFLTGDETDEDGNESEVNEALPVPLPEEMAELAAGRDDNVDDDDVVQAILRAREKHRKHPPPIACDDGVAALSFHPESPIIAMGTFTGDVLVYKYTDESCDLVCTNELHTKSVRGVEFSDDGQSFLSCSKDKSILATSLETGKLTHLWEKAHSSAVQTLYVIDENRFCSGCEEGYVKMWDTRQQKPVFSVRVMEDVVNAMISTTQRKHLVVACGGVITSINLNARKIQVQSEEYENDFTCLGLFRHDTKLVAGSSKGTMFLFNWGEFGLHCDEFTGFKQPVSCLLPVTETVAVTGWEDGKLRATHLFPHQPLGVVGHHDFSVECLDISHDGAIIASAAAAGGHVKFWNIKYIEEIEVSCTKRKKRKPETNLPSSSVLNPGDFFSGLAGPS